MPAELTTRGAAKLEALRAEFAGVRDGRTLLMRDERNRSRWWTFAGGRANAALAAGLEDHGVRVTGLDDLSVGLAGFASATALDEATDALQLTPPAASAQASELESLKFSDCLPLELGLEVISRRRADPEAVRVALSEPRDVWDDVSGARS